MQINDPSFQMLEYSLKTPNRHSHSHITMKLPPKPCLLLSLYPKIFTDTSKVVYFTNDFWTDQLDLMKKKQKTKHIGSRGISVSPHCFLTSDVSWIIRMTHSCTMWRSGYVIAPDLHIKHRRGGWGEGGWGRIMGFWLHYTLRIWFQFGCTSTVIITALNSWQDWMTKLVLG